MLDNSIEKIIYNQNILESNASEIFSELETFISSIDSIILELAFVPLYFMIVNSNTNNHVYNFSKFSIRQNLYVIINDFKFRYSKINHINGNNLSRQYFRKEVSINKIISFSKNKHSDHLSHTICKHFNLSNTYHKTLSSQINLWYSFYDYIFEQVGENECFNIGTGSKVSNQIISYIVKKRGGVINRFSHGGDRGFFRDKLFYRSEFRNTDKYCVHGFHEYKGLSCRIDKKIIGSPYHRKLFQKSNHLWSKTLVYCLPSNVSPNHHFPKIKFTDYNQYKIQLLIIKLLKLSGYKVILKTHPKGVKSPFFEEIKKLSDGVLLKSMEESLIIYDNWVFDIFGSACVEAISANKNIIYFDFGLRLRSPYFNNLNDKILILSSLNIPSYSYLVDYFQSINDLREKFTIGFHESIA